VRRASKDIDKTVIDKADKTKPWTEEKIILRKSIPIQKEIEKEMIETVELKSSKVTKPIDQKPSLEKIDMKPVTKEKANIKEIIKSAEYIEQEDTTLLQVSTEMHDIIESKPGTSEKLAREKKDDIKDVAIFPSKYEEKEDTTLLKVMSEHKTTINIDKKKQDEIPQEKPQSKSWMEEKIILKKTKTGTKRST